MPSPEPNPTQIDVCDDDNDGYAEFDLEQRTLEITNNEPNVVISYHETQTDAETGVNPIVGLYTNIVANTQMIEVYPWSGSTLYMWLGNFLALSMSIIFLAFIISMRKLVDSRMTILRGSRN